MRAIGAMLLAIGVAVVIGALFMDVSVYTGGGRVNNIGLMAERQNYTIVGGILFIAGLLVVLLSKSKSPMSAYEDERTCPLCAEPVKSAAVRCKHCGGDISTAGHAIPVAIGEYGSDAEYGWTVVIPTSNAGELSRRIGVANELGMTVVSGAESPILCGYYDSRLDADKLCQRLLAECGINAQTKYVPG